MCQYKFYIVAEPFFHHFKIGQILSLKSVETGSMFDVYDAKFMTIKNLKLM